MNRYGRVVEGGGVPLLLVVLLLLVVAGIAGGVGYLAGRGAALPQPKPKLAEDGGLPGEKRPIVVPWSEVPSHVVIDDVDAEIVWAARLHVVGNDRRGNPSNFWATVVKIALTNKSRTRKVEFDGWYDATLKDELGNSYKRYYPPSGWSFVFAPSLGKDDSKDIPDHSITLAGFDLMPGTRETRLMLFDELVKPATEIRLTIPEDQAKGKREARLRAIRQPDGPG